MTRKDSSEKKESRRRPQNSGFKRKDSQRAKDTDELLASGPDAEEEAPAESVSDPAGEVEPEVKPRRPRARKSASGVSLKRGGSAPRPAARDGVRPNEACTDEDSAESKVEDSETGDEVTPKRGLGASTSRRRPMSFGSGSAKESVTVAEAEDGEEPEEETDAPKKRGISLGSSKKPRASAKEKSETTEKPKKITIGGAAKKEKPAKGKPPKSTRSTRKHSTEDEPAEDLTPKSPTVIVAPESIGSQILTLIEVVAGAGITFFGATQVGNILITNIMSGALGG